MSKVYGRTTHPGLNSPELKGPAMYTCASRVKMPQIGSDETDLTSRTPLMLSLDRPVFVPPSLPKTVSEGYVKTISSDLSFDESVVKDRCFHTLPYDQKYFQEALDISDIVPHPPKTQYTMARHNKRGPDKRHAPCHLQKRTTHKLKPLKRKILDRALEMHKQALEDKAKKEQAEVKSSYQSVTNDTGFFLTESTVPHSTVPPSTARYSQMEMASSNNWDEYLLSILSDDTSHWIASHQSDPHYNQDRLKTFLKDRHGWVDVRAELIKDSASEADFPLGPTQEQEEQTEKKWRRPDETMLDRVREATIAQGLPTDPYNDDTNAAFYRLPAGFRQAKKAQEKEEDAACNSTAFNIEVRRFEAPPPPTIRDFINPKVGNTMHETHNNFEQEWLTGGQQIHQKYEGKDRIFMNGNKYKKILQKESPRKPDQWFPLSAREAELREQQKKSLKIVEKGLHRWKALPEPVDEAAANETSNLGQDVLGSHDGSESTQRFLKTKTTLTKVVHDWRSKWHLDMRYADASPEDLIKDMADIHPHIRLKAITTCARASEYKPPPEQGISLESQPEKVDYIKLLPENLFIALECCLEDKHERVALTAAIALYTLERPNEKAEVILRKALNQQGGSVDRWAAAQCLAYFGECDSEVVGELVYQLLEAEDPIRHQQAAELLSHLSENSTLVHSMLAEQLNSSSWRHRVMACMVIPKLQGNINKDLVHKLAHLMWHDWHREVRKACAQTLGKTGHGKDVHDELLEKMKQGNEKTRVEAVSKVGHLGIMTAKLLPIFLQCFHDEYVSVRIEACIACSNLKIKDDKVLEKLIFAATYDAIWKVKALAIQAMGATGASTKAARECILWAFRFEAEAGVRAEACEAIMKLKMNDPEVVSILQDRFLVEGSDVVRGKLTEALEMFGVSPSEDMDMVAQIKGEVRKLCTKSKIALQITVNEIEDEQRENKQRMIYIPPEEAKKDQQRYRPFSQLSHMSSTMSRKLMSGRDPTPMRPAYSRESSVVDKEIQEIFEKAKRGRLTPETLSQYTESRPATSVSTKSKKNECLSEAEDDHLDQDEDEEVDSDPVSASQDANIPALEEAEDQKRMVSTPIDDKPTQGTRQNTQDGSQLQDIEAQSEVVASPIKPIEPPQSESATTPKATTEAMFMDGDTNVHDLSDSFTLPGSLHETQSQFDITNTSQSAVAEVGTGIESRTKSVTDSQSVVVEGKSATDINTDEGAEIADKSQTTSSDKVVKPDGTASESSTVSATGVVAPPQSSGSTAPGTSASSFKDAASVKSLAREPSELGSILEEPELHK